MGTIVEFPADAASRRTNAGMYMAAGEATATILILPAVRIERHAEDISDGSGPGQGATAGRGRKRRARS